MGNVFSVSCPCDAIVTRCWDSIVGQESYVRKLEENLQDLSISLEELTSSKNDVKRRVEVAEQQQHFKRLDQVQNWILRVETVESHVNQVIKDGTQEIEKLCCGGYCSKSYVSSYNFGKKLDKKLVELSDLKSKGVFQEVVVETLPAASVNERPLEPIVGMETVFDKVWNHIEDIEVRVIGLYGMGGVGKTTLLTKINNNFFHTPNDFTPVIWIVVSKDIKVEMIQEKIAKEVGIIDDMWKDKAEHDKAQQIFSVLRGKKFVLLLDDIWDRVDLTKVGVPVSNQGNNSKIIFTTRSKDVCGRMGAHKKIRVECLDEYKAMKLFQEKVGKETISIDPDIPKLAEVVAKECCGLPLALITVGQAMASKKTPQEWNHAIHVLKKSAAEFSGMGDEVFPLLKFSYDNLPSRKVKSCFLYCALFPEDFVISRDNLLYLWMCEEILERYANVEEARNETYYILGTLVNACLLEDEEDGVKMHDVIRDMALWLACDPEKRNESFLVQTGAQLTEAPAVGEWKNSKRVSFIANCIENLVETPKSPNLLTLLLRDNNLKTIAQGFFDLMPILQVLDLSENKCLIKLPCGVSKLVSLQHLNLSGTCIVELPVELKALTRLLYLNFEDTTLHFVPEYTISSLYRLRVLRMSGCFFCNLILFRGREEVQGLKHLDELTLSINGISYLKQLFRYPRLLPCIRTLELSFYSSRDCDFNLLEISNYTGLKILEDGTARRAAQGRRAPMTRQPYCFLGLRSVTIVSSSVLTDLTWLIVHAQNLESLSVSDCRHMEKIIDGRKLIGMESLLKEWKPFAKLRKLILDDVPGLKCIYEIPMNIPHLKILHISRCEELKKMPFNSSCAQGCRDIIIKGEQKWWDGLEWEDRLARNAFLPFFIPSTK